MSNNNHFDAVPVGQVMVTVLDKLFGPGLPPLQVPDLCPHCMYGVRRDGPVDAAEYQRMAPHLKVPYGDMYCDCELGRAMAHINLPRDRQAKEKWEAEAPLRAQQEIRRRQRPLAEAGLPAAYWGYTFESFRVAVSRATIKWTYIDLVKPLLAAAAIVTKGWSYRGVLATGPKGTGRGGLLIPIFVHRLVEMGQSGLYAEYGSFMSDIRGGYDDGSAHRLIARAKEVDVFLLRNLGKHNAKPTSHTLDIMEQILTARVGNPGLTLVTSALTPAEMEQQFGEDVAYSITNLGYPIAFGLPRVGA